MDGGKDFGGSTEATENDCESTGSLSEDDEIALGAFCEDVELQEIQFERWQEVHSSLDLYVELYITKIQASAAGSSVVEYMQTTLNSEHKAAKPLRVKVQSKVKWLFPIEDGHIVLVKNAGDRADLLLGDLRVTIKINRK